MKLILNEGFLPPPYSIIQSTTGLETPQPMDNSGKDLGKDRFSSLLLRLKIPLKPQHENFIKLPYDYFCPTVKPSLSGRCCDVCGLYFATKKGVKNHKSELHGQPQDTEIIEPLKIVAERNDEFLCYLNDGFSDSDNIIAEWHQKNMVSTAGVEFPVDEIDNEMQIISSLEDWIENPFEEKTYTVL